MKSKHNLNVLCPFLSSIALWMAVSLACNAVNPVVTATPEITATPTAIPSPTPLLPQPGPDSDGDWVTDPDEAKFGTDASKQDTDEDGLPDFEEIFMVKSDPLIADMDEDGDGYLDDSDEDSLLDITEMRLYGSDPNNFDEDRDNDGIPDLAEIKNGSDPGKIDTDGDLLSDRIEVYLTKSDPASPDLMNGHGFPEPLTPWLPSNLQNAKCEYQVNASVEQLYVIDPEEADGYDISLGDEIFFYYGLWVNPPPDDLFFDEFPRVWSGSGLVKNSSSTNFQDPPSVTASCGDTVTLALKMIEDDGFLGQRDFGLFRHDMLLIFNRIPLEWTYTDFEWGMFFEGTGGDSDYFRYEIDYLFYPIFSK